MATKKKAAKKAVKKAAPKKKAAAKKAAPKKKAAAKKIVSARAENIKVPVHPGLLHFRNLAITTTYGQLLYRGSILHAGQADGHS